MYTTATQSWNLKVKNKKKGIKLGSREHYKTDIPTSLHLSRKQLT